MIPSYPAFAELDLSHRALLHPLFREVAEPLAALTFASLHFCRSTDRLTVSQVGEGTFVFAGVGRDGTPYFLSPFGLPGKPLLDELFGRFREMPLVTASQAPSLEALGYTVREDRDAFEYLYARKDLAELAGRKYAKKRDHVNAFRRRFACTALPLGRGTFDRALHVVESWCDDHGHAGDCSAAREALAHVEELGLCGFVYEVEGVPVGCACGEEIGDGSAFAVHFEKAVEPGTHKGIYQHICQSFAASLPEKTVTLNRGQDLGDPGMRQAKESYHPSGFMKVYRAGKA